MPSSERGSIRRFLRARDYLAASFEHRISLNGAATVAGLSPFHLQRVFARTFGETPHEFVTHLRIDRAKQLLLAGNHSVTDICFDLGYESLGSFSIRFRQQTGLSPSEFRREARRLFPGPDKRSMQYYIPACFQNFL